MKKYLFLVVAMFALSLTAMASEDKPITVDKMPQKAQQFIKKHFGNRQVAMAKMETDFLSKSYDVIFTNGDKIELDKKGEWTNIDCKYSEVPVDIIPAPIRDYVNKTYPGTTIKQIEKERRGYDVELSNGWELKFNRSFQVVDMDD